MSRQLSLRATAVGLQRDDRHDGSFRRRLRADATGTAPTEPTQPAAPAPPDPATADATAADAPEEPIGNVATVTGSASVIRNDKTTPLKVKDEIYLNDVVQTGTKSALGITFIDATTFNLKASTKITIDNYVYEDGGKSNAAIFDVAKGTAAFVAASVAKTGDMKITTPTATLGIRGTTGLVEVPEGAAANNPNNVAVKLYPDADGRVGRIEVNDRAGARLGFLTQGASGFTIRPGAGGARFAAVPLAIPQAVMLRDQGFVRQLHSTQNVGRQLVFQQREFRRANPGFVNPNRPIRQLQPGQRRPNGLPGQRRRNGLPGQPGQPPLPSVPNRPGQQQPGQLNRPGQQQPGQLNRPGQQQQPGAPEAARVSGSRVRHRRPGTPPRAGQPQQPARRTARTATACGTTARSDLPPQPGLPPRAGQPQQPSVPTQPAAPLGTARTAEQVRRARAAARARRSGSACSCSVRDCPPRRGGPRPRRQRAASRRQRNCAELKSASGVPALRRIAGALHRTRATELAKEPAAGF